MIESVLAAKPLVAAIALGTMWILEGIIPMFEGRRERARHGAVNLALGVGNAAVAAFLLAAVTLVATEWARQQSFGLLHWLDLEGVWAFVAALVLFDLWQYVWHRMNHRIPFLWRFHAVHHADREIDSTSGLRFHTGEIVLSSFARLLVLPLLGMTVPQLLLYETILLPVILFHHSNLRLPGRYDRWLRWLVVTPWMHWVHHSQYQPETDSNYSSVLSFWDRLFGSYRLVADPQKLTLGLEDMERHEWGTLPGVFAMPFRKRRGGRGRAADRTSGEDAAGRARGPDAADRTGGGEETTGGGQDQ